MVESKSSEAAASKDVEPKATPDAKEEESKTPTGATSDSGDSASTKVSQNIKSICAAYRVLPSRLLLLCAGGYERQ